MLRHSSVPVAPSQDPNGAVNQEELRIVSDSLRREIRQSQNLSIPIQLPVPQRMSIATPPHDTQSACAGYPPAFQGPPSPVKGPRSAHASTATPPFVPPPGQSPSGSSSSSKEGQGPGGFPFGWPDGPPTPSNPGGSSFGGSPHSQHPSLHSVGVGSASLSSEESVYRYKALQSIKIDSLPQDAAAFRGWKNGLVTKLWGTRPKCWLKCQWMHVSSKTWCILSSCPYGTKTSKRRSWGAISSICWAMPADSCFSKGPIHVAAHRSAFSVELE